MHVNVKVDQGQRKFASSLTRLIDSKDKITEILSLCQIYRRTLKYRIIK